MFYATTDVHAETDSSTVLKYYDSGETFGNSFKVENENIFKTNAFIGDSEVVRLQTTLHVSGTEDSLPAELLYSKSVDGFVIPFTAYIHLESIQNDGDVSYGIYTGSALSYRN